MVVKGIITALVTPLNSDGTLCENCLKELIEFQAKNGIQGLYLTGTAGEGIILPLDVRVKVFEKALEYAPKNMYLLPHVGAANIDEVLYLAKHAKDLGYRDISVIGPIFHKPSRKGLIKYFEYIASKSELNIIVYNNTCRQGYNISPEDFQTITEVTSSVKGIKDTSRDISQLLEYVKKFSSKYFIAGAGDEFLFYTFVIGAHAHVCAVSNVVPELVLKLYKNIVEGRLQEALDIQYKLTQLRKIIAKMTSEAQEGIREFLKLRGLNPGYPPIQMVHEFDSKLIEEAKRLLNTILFEG
ncbi:MAG: dihydrodipicolinate synthase family protein [Ignisphaera sp.]